MADATDRWVITRSWHVLSYRGGLRQYLNLGHAWAKDLNPNHTIILPRREAERLFARVDALNLDPGITVELVHYDEAVLLYG